MHLSEQTCADLRENKVGCLWHQSWNDSRLDCHVTLLSYREEELATNSSKETVLSDATTVNHTHATDKI